MALAFERRVDLEGHRFLRSHVIGGRPVLPVAMMMEWMGHAAMHAHPGMGWLGIDDLQVMRATGVGEEGLLLRFFAGAMRRDGEAFAVWVEIRAAEEKGRETVRARGRVWLGDRPSCVERFEEGAGKAVEAYRGGVTGAYGDVLFHGEMLRVIESVEGIWESGIAARMGRSSRPDEWMGEPMRSEWLGDPSAVDGALQAAILWGHERMGVLSLPMRVERYRQYRGFPAEGTRAIVEIARRGSRDFVADVSFVGAGGVVVARMEGLGMIGDGSLAAAFGKGSASAGGMGDDPAAGARSTAAATRESLGVALRGGIEGEAGSEAQRGATGSAAKRASLK